VLVLGTHQNVANRCTDYAILFHLLMIRHHNLYRYFRRILEKNFLRADLLNMAFLDMTAKFSTILQVLRYWLTNKRSVRPSLSFRKHSILFFTLVLHLPEGQAGEAMELSNKQYSFTLLGALGRRGLRLFFARVKCLNSYSKNVL